MSLDCVRQIWCLQQKLYKVSKTSILDSCNLELLTMKNVADLLSANNQSCKSDVFHPKRQQFLDIEAK